MLLIYAATIYSNGPEYFKTLCHFNVDMQVGQIFIQVQHIKISMIYHTL